MTKQTRRRFILTIADLLLPDYCAVCGLSLALNRSGADPHIPLCGRCIETADKNIFSERYPEIDRCLSCGYPLTSENGLCSRCRERCADKAWMFSSADSIFLYAGITKQLITSYKFDNRRDLSYYFAEKINDYYKRDCIESVIVPVPFRPAPKKKRGWDHIEIICRILHKNYGMPVAFCLRRKNGPAQKTMTYTQRLLNLKDNIMIRPGAECPPEVLLIDDVFTTGATMDYCASILRNAGAEEVRCLAIALDL